LLKKILIVTLQIIVAGIIIPAVAFITMSFENRNNDGPSILFPGGELISGELYFGPEPDWGFTNEVSTIHLQLDDPLSSRLIGSKRVMARSISHRTIWAPGWVGAGNTGQYRHTRVTDSQLFVSTEFVMSGNSLEFFTALYWKASSIRK